MAVVERVRSRHCLEVVDCATDKTRDIRSQRANWNNKGSQSWVKGPDGEAMSVWPTAQLQRMVGNQSKGQTPGKARS